MNRPARGIPLAGFFEYDSGLDDLIGLLYLQLLMALFRTNWFLALALSALAIVAVQAGICAFECAGLIPCLEQSSAHSESSPETSNESSPTQCCHSHCHSSFVTTQAISAAVFDRPSTGLVIFQDTIPDEIVREVEYPPQLS